MIVENLVGLVVKLVLLAIFARFFVEWLFLTRVRSAHRDAWEDAGRPNVFSFHPRRDLRRLAVTLAPIQLDDWARRYMILLRCAGRVLVWLLVLVLALSMVAGIRACTTISTDGSARHTAAPIDGSHATDETQAHPSPQ